MSGRTLQYLAALACGALFGAGLVLARATEPRVVLGFLDWFGAWDPSLLVMMIGAVLTHAPLYRWLTRRERPQWAQSLSVPTEAKVDTSLIGGSALFGVGWGLSGYCPGPSVVALASGRYDALVVLGSIALGIAIAARLPAMRRRST